MELHYQQYGEGHPLIILHGLFGMSDNWVTHARRFAEDFSVFAVDQRNHGKSGWHKVFNYDAMADDLVEFMDNHGLKSAHLLGHSMGGKTAMQFALDHPHKVDKLLVADMSPDEYNHRHDSIIDSMLSVDLDQFSSRSEVEKELQKTIPDQGVRLFLLKNLYWKDRGSLGWKVNLEVVLENLTEVFRVLDADHSFSKPTLFLRGSESPYILPKHHPQIKKLFPDAQIKTIEGASHWLHAEKPKEFYEMALEFFKTQ